MARPGPAWSRSRAPTCPPAGPASAGPAGRPPSDTGGEWLLFLDADTQPQPAMITDAIAHAEPHRLDLLTLMPFIGWESFWEKAIMPAFFSMIQAAYPIHEVNGPAPGWCWPTASLSWCAGPPTSGPAATPRCATRCWRMSSWPRRWCGPAAACRRSTATGCIAVRMYTNGAEVREGLTKNAIAGLRDGGIRSTWAGVRQAWSPWCRRPCWSARPGPPAAVAGPAAPHRRGHRPWWWRLRGLELGRLYAPAVPASRLDRHPVPPRPALPTC